MSGEDASEGGEKGGKEEGRESRSALSSQAFHPPSLPPSLLTIQIHACQRSASQLLRRVVKENAQAHLILDSRAVVRLGFFVARVVAAAGLRGGGEGGREGGRDGEEGM